MSDTDTRAERSAPNAFGIRLDTALVVVIVLALAVLALQRSEPEALPDFSTIETVDSRKSAFFEFLAPIVVEENERVRLRRERLLELAPKVRDDERLPVRDRLWVERLAERHELEWPGESRTETFERLVRRVDIVPVPLALVQAATESGWGRSRFAREGNNLFGQWCYTPGCGLVPAQRTTGAAHEVAAFESVRESVRRYINNLNTHPSYQPLRDIRAELRRQGRMPHALALADGLVRYSERRQAYVEEIKQVIRTNRLLIEDVMPHTPSRVGESEG